MNRTRPERLNVVILAAGRCSRMARPYPKALATLADGRTILQRQLDLLSEVLGDDTNVCIVVGFMPDLILAAAGRRALFAFNEAFDRTNTAHSLMRALDLCSAGSVLWLNGDVVFDRQALVHLAGFLGDEEGLVAVCRSAVGDEEVKYRLDHNGCVAEISKGVAGSPGEAVGINYVPGALREEFTRHLRRCSEEDYFEHAIETSAGAGLRFRAVDITGYGCVEVDFETDLVAANDVVRRSAMPSIIT